MMVVIPSPAVVLLIQHCSPLISVVIPETAPVAISLPISWLSEPLCGAQTLSTRWWERQGFPSIIEAQVNTCKYWKSILVSIESQYLKINTWSIEIQYPSQSNTYLVIINYLQVTLQHVLRFLVSCLVDFGWHLWTVHNVDFNTWSIETQNSILTSIENLQVLKIQYCWDSLLPGQCQYCYWIWS